MACNKEPVRVEKTRLIADIHQAKQTAKGQARKMAKKCEYCSSRVTLHWRERHIICNECLLQHGISIIARLAAKTSLVEVNRGVPPKVSSKYDSCLHSNMPINVEQVMKTESRKMSSNARRGGGANREVKNLQQWKTTDDSPQRNTGPMRRGTLVNGHGSVGRLKYDEDDIDPDYDPKVNTKFNPYLNPNRSKPPRPPKKKRST